MVISARRSLAVVGAAVGVFLAVAWIGAAVSYFVSNVVSANSSQTWAGLGALILGFAISGIVGFVAAIAAVAIGTRHREGSVLFTLLFVVSVVAVGLLVYAIGGLGVLTIPLIWALPTAIVTLTHRNGVPIAALVVVVAVVVGVLGGFLGGKLIQDAFHAAYSGPRYGPSDSPESPLAGHVLRSVSLPNRPDQYEGETMMSLFYWGDLGLYDVNFTVGDYELSWCLRNPSCVVVGEAHGAPVYRADANGNYYLALDGGVIELTGYLTVDEALAVYNDLQPMTLDEIGRLDTVPVD